MIDISGFGASITVAALQTFPMGFNLSEFADDQDPLKFEEVEPTGFEFLYDGNPFFFDKAAIIRVSIAVVPGGDDDTNLKILLQSRKGSQSIIPLPDSTTMTVNYPNGGRVILTNGSILSGPFADSITQQARKKGNVYTFGFGSFAGAQNPRQLIASIAQNILSLF
ncbi:hypothetical protein BcepF1.106 [Burkholderia phage BcepF1]|uniref:Uncharacterized protein n=1 Tax=Burkholderia phage BcepF1 TaxID=2886897 RepID=A1Z010_9CAUD|nr:tail fiber protein [Burkholderia phage BcepF1]ABL96837.1 hypothetical protein BcepF1.106 [Burkholderia phage BcepF1]